jgi:GT2 family glycosyltransferase
MRALQHVALLTPARVPQNPRTEVIVIDRFGWGKARNPLSVAYPTARVIHSSESMSSARAANVGLRYAKGVYVLLLAPEVVVLPGAIRSLIDLLKENPCAAAVGPRFLNEDGSVLTRPRPGQALRQSLARPEDALRLRSRDLWQRDGAVDWLPSACLMLRMSALEDVGLLDEDFGLALGEADWCRRARAKGWELRVSKDASVRCTEPPAESVPPEGAETRRAPDARWRYFRKHHGMLRALAAEVAVRTNLAYGA